MAGALGPSPSFRMEWEWRREPAGLLRRAGGTHAASRKEERGPGLHPSPEITRRPILFPGQSAVFWRLALPDPRRPGLLHFAQSPAALLAQSMGRAPGAFGQETEPPSPDPLAQKRLGQWRRLEPTVHCAHRGAAAHLRVG